MCESFRRPKTAIWTKQRMAEGMPATQFLGTGSLMVIEALRILPHAKVRCAVNLDQAIWVQAGLSGVKDHFTVMVANGPELEIIYKADLLADWISGKDSRQ